MIALVRNTYIFLLTIGLVVGCQSTSSISANEAKNLPELTYLPLLTVQAVTPATNGYEALLYDKDHTAFQAFVSQSKRLKNAVKLQPGERVKIIGDYDGSEPIRIMATQIIRIR